MIRSLKIMNVKYGYFFLRFAWIRSILEVEFLWDLKKLYESNPELFRTSLNSEVPVLTIGHVEYFLKESDFDIFVGKTLVKSKVPASRAISLFYRVCSHYLVESFTKELDDISDSSGTLDLIKESSRPYK